MPRKLVLFGSFIVLVATITVVGCSNSTPVPDKSAGPQSEPKPGAAAPEEHAHKPGTHGGIILALGKDSYHAEAVFNKGGVRLYMLGKEETRVQEVESQELSAFVTSEGSAEAVPVTFKPEPQQGDAEGKTSLFVATLPAGLAGTTVNVTINNISIGKERFRIGFSNATSAHAETAMPAKKATAEEEKLFLTPDGLYTAADVKANGATVPTVKFHGIRPTHEASPMPGQKVCPISKTLANPKFAWVIGGKTYVFCCVPCIEEFLTTAKDKPAEIKDPSEYVQK